MAKVRPELPEGWDVESFVLAKLLGKNTNVLFIYNEDYSRIQKIVNMFGITATIMNDDVVELEKARKFGFNVIVGNINAGGLDEINDKEYDYVVAEEVLPSARYPSDFLKDLVRISNYAVVSNENKAYWRNRLRFLCSGSMYVGNQYNVIPDDSYAWFNGYPWTLTHKDVVNLCACNEFIIRKGTMIYKNGYIDNIYDIRSYPNMKAVKVYYLITNDSSIIPSGKLGGLRAI